MGLVLILNEASSSHYLVLFDVVFVILKCVFCQSFWIFSSHKNGTGLYIMTRLLSYITQVQWNGTIERMGQSKRNPTAQVTERRQMSCEHLKMVLPRGIRGAVAKRRIRPWLQTEAASSQSCPLTPRLSWDGERLLRTHPASWVVKSLVPTPVDEDDKCWCCIEAARIRALNKST